MLQVSVASKYIFSSCLKKQIPHNVALKPANCIKQFKARIRNQSKETFNCTSRTLTCLEYLNVQDVNSSSTCELLCSERSVLTYAVVTLRSVCFSGNLDKQTARGSTALHYCCLTDNSECLKLLLRGKASVTISKSRKPHVTADSAHDSETRYKQTVKLLFKNL